MAPAPKTYAIKKKEFEKKIQHLAVPSVKTEIPDQVTEKRLGGKTSITASKAEVKNSIHPTNGLRRRKNKRKTERRPGVLLSSG